MEAKRISILGVGLLGGSMGLAIKSRLKGCRVVGYGHRPATIDAALKIGALDEGYTSIAPAVAGADMIVLCTPVGLFESILEELRERVGPQTVITDVGSTKRSIVQLAMKLLPHPGQFVGSHPMAGSEKRGVEHARADLYDGGLCILTPTDQTDPAAIQKVEELWLALGMRLCRVSPQEHDRRLADVSHLPHALAAALMSIQEPQSIPLAGKGFHDMTRIAGGDGVLWRDIFLDNRDNVLLGIGRLKQRLDLLSDMLENNQDQALRDWLNQVAARRLEGINSKVEP